jgi:hypothetical protein
MTHRVTSPSRSPARTYCRKHAFARFSPNVSLGTQVQGCSPRWRQVSYDLQPRLAVGCSVGRYYDPATGQFLSVDPMVQRTQQAYAYAGDDPLNGKDPTGNITECRSRTYQHERMHTSQCGIWPSDYLALKKLGVKLTSPTFVQENGLWIYGPVFDFISQKGIAPKNISISLHLIQDDLYGYMNYTAWLDTWTGPLADFVQLSCAGQTQCLPSYWMNKSYRVDGTVAWMEWKSQMSNLTTWTTGELETVEQCGEMAEWLPDGVGAAICAGSVLVNNA